MKKRITKIAACLLASASLVTGVFGMSASAYNNVASMTLRNVSGAPGNVTSGNLTINSKEGSASYTTSYDFANNTSATLDVSTTNAISNVRVTLNKNNRSKNLNNVEARYSYITFSGNLNNSYGEAGIWSVS